MQAASGQVLVALARPLPVGLAPFGGARVVALVRSVLDRPAGRVRIAVAGVLDQLALGLLEALGLAAAAFEDSTHGLTGRLVSGRLGADTAAYRRGFGRGGLGFFSGSIGSWHDHGLPAGFRGKRARAPWDAAHRPAEISRLAPRCRVTSG